MNHFAITIDTDWAPDFAIEYVAKALTEFGVKSTWFLTHSSAALTNLQHQSELFELGIHPNFLPGSSHGASDALILDHMLKIVPQAKVVRTHALVQSTPLLYKMASDFGLTLDVSLFLPDSAHLKPHDLYLYDQRITRVPYFWEDDVEAYTPHRSWHLSTDRYHVPGLKIFNFHPMYVYLNCDTMDGYAQLKQLKHLPDLDEATCEPFVNKGAGTKTLFLALVEYIASKQSHSTWISDIANMWRQESSTRASLTS